MPLFTKQYKLVPAIGWEGNRRCGVALAMHHRLSAGMAWEREMEYYGIFNFLCTELKGQKKLKKKNDRAVDPETVSEARWVEGSMFERICGKGGF